MDIPVGYLKEAIKKLESFQGQWVISVSHDGGVDGSKAANYASEITYSSAGLQVAVTLSGDERGDAARPWIATILVCQDYSDGSPKDQLYFGSFEYGDDMESFRLLARFVEAVTASTRQVRADRLGEARANFFRLNPTTP